eukprot:scaffold48_cov395-Prasinococcus_capsulatus_cf.AAC.13
MRSKLSESRPQCAYLNACTRTICVEPNEATDEIQRQHEEIRNVHHKWPAVCILHLADGLRVETMSAKRITDERDALQGITQCALGTGVYVATHAALALILQSIAGETVIRGTWSALPRTYEEHLVEENENVCKQRAQGGYCRPPRVLECGDLDKGRHHHEHNDDPHRLTYLCVGEKLDEVLLDIDYAHHRLQVVREKLHQQSGPSPKPPPGQALTTRCRSTACWQTFAMLVSASILCPVSLPCPLCIVLLFVVEQ